MNFKTFTLNGISVFLGLIFFSSGMAKLYFEHKFPGIIGPVWLEEKLAQFDLGLFARFIAYSQISIGFMLATLRYRTIGAIMLLPMLLNILLVTVSQNWVGTPYVLAFFLILNIILLAAEVEKLVHLLGFSTTYIAPAPTRPWFYTSVWLVGYLMVLGSISFSYSSLIAAYLLCGAGLSISLFPYFKTGRVGAVSPTKITNTHEVLA